MKLLEYILKELDNKIKSSDDVRDKIIKYMEGGSKKSNKQHLNKINKVKSGFLIFFYQCSIKNQK